ncbi:hypothetical protein BOTBODRAFT_134921 [Botryobasidium botryosum FD-172 SS1]|uniref:SMODS and SLOG-associating 2TM effector domain-containing protein n=1 Tax=Botryobasidium botryosum (strain FD-172 SS1) TaxID=930990 RepID=A0A067M9Z3_BOTB1|nr:hypothetical protein BOTBODRAFT_134921 [Botryobasidium botryosum FD-172 SS1]
MDTSRDRGIAASPTSSHADTSPIAGALPTSASTSLTASASNIFASTHTANSPHSSVLKPVDDSGRTDLKVISAPTPTAGAANASNFLPPSTPAINAPRASAPRSSISFDPTISAPQPNSGAAPPNTVTPNPRITGYAPDHAEPDTARAPEQDGRYFANPAEHVTYPSPVARAPLPHPVRTRPQEGARVSQILNDGNPPLPDPARARTFGANARHLRMRGTTLGEVDEKSLSGLPSHDSHADDAHHGNGPNVRWPDRPVHEISGGLEMPAPQHDMPSKSVRERLTPTLETARVLQKQAARKSFIMGWALNIAIGLQVVLGSLITALAAVTTGRSTSVMTAVLGALSTIIASFLARARGTNEPERSKAHSNSLQKYIRDLQAFLLDFGDEVCTPGDEIDVKVRELRDALEELENTTQRSERTGSSIA